MIHPLTLWVDQVDSDQNGEAFGRCNADQLFSRLDELCTAPLERADSENNAQFVVELVVGLDPEMVTVHLRESIVVMASRQIAAKASLQQCEEVAAHFALMIDVAAECYASPLTAA